MGCLFGYCGLPAPGLLEGMAKRLSHRCALGWERVSHRPREEHIIEIGHGIAPWSTVSQTRRFSTGILGYSGILFNGDGLAAGDIFPHERGAEQPLSDSPGQTIETGLEQLDGAFALALAFEQDLYLARDPAGMKVLYWTAYRGRLLFASEIKALFAEPTLPRRMRAGALAEYLTFSFIPGAQTMFEDIEELQPGSILVFSQGQAQVRRHFLFEDLEVTATKPEQESIAEVRSTLESSVRECWKASPGATPAVFLSGGIDSSAVLATASTLQPHTCIPTFSVHFGSSYAHENDFVALMVKRYRTDHHWLEIQPAGFIKQLRKIIWHLDDPIGDPVTVPNYLLSHAAAQVTNVVLNGEGGDPCFGGPKNIPMLLTRLYGPLPGEPSRGWLERSYLLAFQRCFQDLGVLLDPVLFREGGGEEALIAILEPFFMASKPRAFLNKLMSMNIRLKGANLILVKVDKMSSAHGLLALAPLFSRRIIETSMICPPGLKLEGAVEKSVLKKAVQDLVPRPIIERPKSGMRVPVRFWFRGEMRRYAKKRLSPRYLNRLGLFNPEYVQKLLDYDLEGINGMRHGLKLWMLITFLLWYEQMVESPS